VDRYRVVFHLNEPGRERAAQVLANIRNLLEDLGEGNVDVELVANGRGATALVQGPEAYADRVAKLAARGVRFVACAHSLRMLELSEESLLPAVDVVSSGVGELVKKQAQGWAYIRP